MLMTLYVAVPPDGRVSSNALFTYILYISAWSHVTECFWAQLWQNWDFSYRCEKLATKLNSPGLRLSWANKQNLCAIVDSDLNFKTSAFNDLINITKMQPFLSEQHRETNAPFYIQQTTADSDSAAWVLTRTRSREHNTSVITLVVSQFPYRF